jgi:hypothetical protein
VPDFAREIELGIQAASASLHNQWTKKRSLDFISEVE